MGFEVGIHFGGPHLWDFNWGPHGWTSKLGGWIHDPRLSGWFPNKDHSHIAGANEKWNGPDLKNPERFPLGFPAKAPDHHREKPARGGVGPRPPIPHPFPNRQRCPTRNAPRQGQAPALAPGDAAGALGGVAHPALPRRCPDFASFVVCRFVVVRVAVVLLFFLGLRFVWCCVVSVVLCFSLIVFGGWVVCGGGGLFVVVIWLR